MKKFASGEEVSPQSILLSFVNELVVDAAKSGDGRISKRSHRQLQRLMNTCIDVAAKDLLHVVVERFAAKHVQEGKTEMEEDFIMSPKGNKTNPTATDKFLPETSLPWAPMKAGAS
jgi:hypothetical protein